MQDKPLNDRQRNAILKGAKMSLLNEKVKQKTKTPTLEDKLEYLDVLIERMEGLITQYEEFLIENHHVSKNASEVSIIMGKNKLVGNMMVQKQ